MASMVSVAGRLYPSNEVAERFWHGRGCASGVGMGEAWLGGPGVGAGAKLGCTKRAGMG
ncbi:hypothetical protein OZX72_09410 [Bifidobacterium sp. ESL0769]|uniref:hypothetical protein n=1 Tax=Bifidobacterium sp. ESL0769 TaxID=2983229 RepID=UPI0023FA43AF|nr:hypothetical protein [Bifidobacterium sp. ESL0769]WEV67428.1 hypothetical protein OZX72_09410 [Bifidobacterium sp. ESL0769]